MPEFQDGEGPIDEHEAKPRAKKLLEDEKLKRPKGHPDDLATQDDRLGDPAKQEKD